MQASICNAGLGPGKFFYPSLGLMEPLVIQLLEPDAHSWSHAVPPDNIYSKSPKYKEHLFEQVYFEAVQSGPLWPCSPDGNAHTCVKHAPQTWPTGAADALCAFPQRRRSSTHSDKSAGTRIKALPHLGTVPRSDLFLPERGNANVS